MQAIPLHDFRAGAAARVVLIDETISVSRSTVCRHLAAGDKAQ
jgi:hypothetical protein